jgi:molybdate transport system regulatory protein
MSATTSDSNPAAPAVKLRMRVMTGDIIAIGPGKIELLEAINETKSIAAAAKSLGMSYRRAWLLVDGINHSLNTPAVITSTGGSHGGGTALTETGHLVVALYRRIEREALKACQSDLDKLVALVQSS